MAGSVLGTLAVRLRADTAEFVRDLKGAEAGLAGVADTAKKVATVAGVAFGGMALLGAKFIKVASDMDENMNVVETSFGKMTPEVIKWARTAASEMGRSEFQMREFAGTTQALLSPMMGSAKAAAAMSMQVAQLAVDIGSFNNVADADALIAIKAGLIGSSEPMIKFGVDVRESALAAFALSQGITTSVKSMTGAQKVALRYAAIMAQTTLQQGDAAKTSEGFANVMKSIEGLMTDVAGEIGAAMLPMVTELAAKIRDLLRWFKGLSPETKEFAAKALMVATALAGTVAGLAAVAAVLPSIIAGFGTMVTVLAAVTPVIAAIGVAVATAGILMVGYKEISKTSTSDIALMWKQLGEDIAGIVGTTSDDVQSTWEELTGAIGDIWSGMIDTVTGLWDDAMDALGKTAIGRLLDDLMGFVPKVLGAWKIVSEGITTFFRGAVTDITALWDWVANSYFGQIAGTIISVFVSIWKGILTVFITPFKLAFSAIAEALSFWGKKLGIISEKTTEAGGALQSFFGISDKDVAAKAGETGPGKPKQTVATTAAVTELKKLLAQGGGKPVESAATKAYEDSIKKSTEELAGFTKKIQKLNDVMAVPLQAVPRGTGLAAPAMPGIAIRGQAQVGPEGVADVDFKSQFQMAAEKLGSDLLVGGEIMANTVISRAGVLGEVMGSAVEGFKAGGPMGAIFGVIADLATRSESFKVSVQNANDAMAKIIEALEPLAKNMKPLAAIVNEILVIIAEQLGPVFEALAPVFNFLFDVVKGLALGILKVMRGVGRAWNGMIQALENLINRIPGVNVDFGRLQFNLNGVNRAIQSLDNITVSSARAEQLRTEETEEATDAIRALNESLTNVPEGFKVAAARYQAIDEGRDGASQDLNTAERGGTININVQTTEEAAEAVVDVLEDMGYSKSGSRVAGGSFAVDTGGA